MNWAMSQGLGRKRKFLSFVLSASWFHSIFIVCPSILFLCLAFGFLQKEASGIVEVEGAHLHYFIQGNGIPCVSLGASITEARILPQKLRQSLKLITRPM
jgi:hypothetical protein